MLRLYIEYLNLRKYREWNFCLKLLRKELKCTDRIKALIVAELDGLPTGTDIRCGHWKLFGRRLLFYASNAVL